jgi:(p)ppGpp synthase/HD superfamily hydrolase
VASAAAALGADIAKAEVETSLDKTARIKLALRVRDIQQLQAIEKEIAANGEVLSVERV